MDVGTPGTHSAIFETKRAFRMKGSLGSLKGAMYQYKTRPKTYSDSLSVAQDLCVAVTESVNDGDDLRVLLQVRLLLLWHECPELVDVDNWAPMRVARQVEVAHTDFTEVTIMVLVHVCTASRKALIYVKKGD